MSDEPTIPPLLRVVRGDPSDEELAALIAVVTTVSRAPAQPAARLRRWNAPARLVRAVHRPGRDDWRASGLPH